MVLTLPKKTLGKRGGKDSVESPWYLPAPRGVENLQLTILKLSKRKRKNAFSNLSVSYVEGEKNKGMVKDSALEEWLTSFPPTTRRARSIRTEIGKNRIMVAGRRGNVTLSA